MQRSVESQAYRLEASGSRVSGGGPNAGGAAVGGGSGRLTGRRRSTVDAVATEQSLVEAAVVEVKRVLDHESAELYRESLSRRDSAVPEPGDAELREVIDELLRTEGNYLRDMRFTVSKFGKPLRELLDAAQTKAIFSNLAQILELHARLVTALPEPEERPSPQRFADAPAPAPVAAERSGGGGGSAASTSSSKRRSSLSMAAKGQAVASAFVKMQPFFKCYATYCANYPYVSGALLKARQEPRVSAFLQGAELTHSTKLQQLLFRPVQRMCALHADCSCLLLFRPVQHMCA